MPTTLAWLPGPWEYIIILIVALLVFGRRLPEVGRSLGRGLVEFKKGLKGLKDEFDSVDEEVRQAGESEPSQDESPRLDARTDDPAAHATQASSDPVQPPRS